MEVCNIKFHFYIKTKFKDLFNKRLSDCEFVKKTYSSFCILRINKIVYSCFYSGFINVTGVRNFELKPVSQKILLSVLGIKQKRKKIFRKSVIDNITSKLLNPTFKKINLVDKRSKFALNENVCTIKYDRQRFPNMFLKTKFGTIIWSPNNIKTVVGSKGFSDLCKIYEIINTLNQL